MRKDVQFGLTIGGSLLAVLVIYLALFNHGSKKPSDVSLVTGGQPQPTADKPAALDVTQGTTPAITSTTPDSIVLAKPDATTQPSTLTDTTSTGRDWNTLLQSGGSTTQPSSTSTSTTITPVPSEPVMIADDTPATRPSETLAARTHKVASGETFYTIAAALYGDSKYFSRLEDANPDVKPNRLRIGTVIKIPELAALPEKAAPTAAAPTALVDLDPAKSYRVRSSDTLMAIARRLYGNGQDWEKIYDANRDTIGPNPARLKIDMVLRLPDPPTVAMAN